VVPGVLPAVVPAVLPAVVPAVLPAVVPAVLPAVVPAVLPVSPAAAVGELPDPWGAPDVEPDEPLGVPQPFELPEPEEELFVSGAGVVVCVVVVAFVPSEEELEGLVVWVPGSIVGSLWLSVRPGATFVLAAGDGLVLVAVAEVLVVVCVFATGVAFTLDLAFAA